MIEAELCRSMKDAVSLIGELNSNIQAIGRTESQLRTTPPGNIPASLADDFQRRDAILVTLYEKSIKLITTILASVEGLTGPATGDGLYQLPSPAEAREKLNQFFMTKPLMRLKLLPAASRGKRGTRPGHFICARFRQTFSLMIVASITPELCIAYDPTNVSRVAQLDPQSLTPLPTVLPEKPKIQMEFTQKAQVLSLWNRSGKVTDWSPEFFWATVVVRTSDREKEEIRGYLLDFGEVGAPEKRNQIVVPEQFIVAVPEGWSR
jgi:hypothetical protein